MNTLTYASDNPIPLTVHPGAVITLVFQLDSGTTKVEKGEFVKLAADGEIEPIAAVTDFPVGYVSNKNPYEEGGYTIVTDAKAQIKGVADGAVITGQLMAVSGNTANVPQFKTAVATNYVVGIALNDAADTEDVEVLILKSTFKLN